MTFAAGGHCGACAVSGIGQSLTQDLRVDDIRRLTIQEGLNVLDAACGQLIDTFLSRIGGMWCEHDLLAGQQSMICGEWFCV
ncbi:MAG: hypothetical protein RLZZ232_1515, partial [Planctomycetota bacterium]